MKKINPITKKLEMLYLDDPIKDLYDQLEVVEQQQYAEALKNKEKKSKASK